MTILLTGAAGFIGHSVAKKLLSVGENVTGLDNLNEYYDKKLKIDRLKNIENNLSNFKGKWKFVKCDIEDKFNLEKVFEELKPKIVINLAAQAGVRYSIENPSQYIKSNIVGFYNILEFCVKERVENFIYASSSSVYGANKNEPFNENDIASHPLSLYAATKRSNELIAHSYSNIYDLPITGLRFFTVYGPWGRPDMAPFIFTKNILEGQPLRLFNHGNMKRDFTYIDDISEAIMRCSFKKATSNDSFNYEYPEISNSFAPYRIFNIGNAKPVNLNEFINVLENELCIKAKKILDSMQLGDVISTYADTDRLEKWIEYKPKTTIKEGVKLFIDWYKWYYGY